VGIITTSDVMRVLLQAIGIDKDSARFSVLVQDRKGVIADISKLLDSNQINIRSLVTWPDQDYPGVYQLVLRVAAKDGEQAMAALTAGGFKVLTEYLQDLSPYLP
jgi:acetoin utilization protein AcuB